MKRTLTAAAAVVASSAGAVGFAGTAAAVDAPGFPENVPMDGSATAMSVRPVEHVTPGSALTPAGQQLTGKHLEHTGGGPAGSLLASSPLGGLAGGEASPLGGAGKAVPLDAVSTLPVGHVVPLGEQLPAEPRAADPLSGLPASSPLGGLLGGNQGNAQQQKPASSQSAKPAGTHEVQPGDIEEQVLDASQGRPTGGDPLTDTAGRPQDKTAVPLADVVSQTPLSSVSDLSG